MFEHEIYVRARIIRFGYGRFWIICVNLGLEGLNTGMKKG